MLTNCVEALTLELMTSTIKLDLDSKGKGKGFPYSIPNDGLGANPGVQQSARR